MEGAKYKVGQKVRNVNEKKYYEIVSIVDDGTNFFYNLSDNWNHNVNRVSEVDLRDSDA